MLVISNENEFLALDAWLNCFHLSCSCSCSTSTSPQYDVDFQDTRGVAAAARAGKEKREERGGKGKRARFPTLPVDGSRKFSSALHLANNDARN